MISKTILCGWLAFPTQIKETKDGTKFLRNALNVPRSYKDQQGKVIYDTINFVVYKANAEYLAKYSKKNDFLILSGRLQSSSYIIKEAVEENGVLVAKDKKINSLELLVEESTIRNGTNIQTTNETQSDSTDIRNSVQVKEDIYDVYARMKPKQSDYPNMYIPED